MVSPDGVLARPIDNLKVPRSRGGMSTGKDNSTMTVLSEPATWQVSMEGIMG